MSRNRNHRAMRFGPDHYFQRSQQPLQCLIFLLPIVMAYEVGTIWFATDVARGRAEFIRARALLDDLLDWLGAGGLYLPVLVLVAILLVSHLVRRDAWRMHPKVYLGMAAESLALALPLLMFGLLARGRPAPPVDGTWQMHLVFSLGAGIYEELVFRLMIIALVHMLLVDVLGAKTMAGAVVAVLVSSALFAAYHFGGKTVGQQTTTFQWPDAIYYFGTGVYFAIVYIVRGFGIVAAAHAAYDLLIVAIMHGLFRTD